ncbi:uncharacterized protein CC84DRAFT_1106147 [Paraphaeosphaeria sporulosa]|uniref:Uncharacterized protein n=1 Tax=Paraphaeosphaeria sporulosa TaxID=1460663 RepID=A0A177BTA2_9PLEO|nr:uncharacterized protein CC84DRAFT_1106147 [Paraphaeosphaeria sporulosa]OAF98534.1 hypothetical protein CC84DRAFT_1106147 [Paraphaeosphaeria sporulosa]
MDAAASVALDVGVRALNALNDCLEEKDTAISWYGKEACKTFTGRSWSLFPRKWKKFSHVKITKVFRIRANDWQKEDSGECCWLPIYHALPKQTQKLCEAEPKRSLGSLGILKSLPAARMDAWGLTVLAIANGARPEVTYAENGGYFASFNAKDFVLTMWQDNIAAPVIGHIEPKQIPSLDRDLLTSPEWNMLLWQGHSFSQHNHISGWPLNGVGQKEPPEDLVTHSRDEEIMQLVMDNEWVERLQNQFRNALYRCYDSWERLQRHPRNQGHIDSNRIDLIKRQLLAFKLILVDGEEPAKIHSNLEMLEIRKEDILHYALEQLKFITEIMHKNKTDSLHDAAEQVSDGEMNGQQ